MITPGPGSVRRGVGNAKRAPEFAGDRNPRKRPRKVGDSTRHRRQAVWAVRIILKRSRPDRQNDLHRARDREIDDTPCSGKYSAHELKRHGLLRSAYVATPFLCRLSL